MLNVVELSKDGSLVDLEAALEDADTQRQQLLDQEGLVASMDLQAAPVASVAASVVVSMVVGAEADLEGDSRTVEAMVVVDEEASATKEVEASLAEVVTGEETVVGMVDRMATTHLQMPPLVQEVVVAAFLGAEGGMVDLGPQIVTALQHRLVGMIRVAAVAHMMTGPADIVAVATEVTIETAHEEVAAAATWSR
jgi:hypothetical protein